MNISENRKRRGLRQLLNILIGLSPAISFLFISPEWLARLLAITGSLFIFMGLLLFHGLNPNSNFSWTKPKDECDRAWRLKERILRCLVICFALLLLYFVAIPEFIDCVNVMRQGTNYLSQVNGKVSNVHFALGAYFLSQSITVTDQKHTEHYLSAYYFNQLFRDGENLQFAIMPRSRIVLDCFRDGNTFVPTPQ